MSFRDMTNEEYHKSYKELPALGSTQIKRANNLAKFKVQVLDNEGEREEKRSFDLGSAAHQLILEGSEANFIVGPDLNKNTNAWKDFVKENAGKIIIDQIQDKQLRGMRRVFLNNDVARSYLMNSKIEKAIFWKDEKTKLDCKAKIDGFVDSEKITVWDYKTTKCADSFSFQKSILEYGYHISAAHYIAGLQKITDKQVIEYLFVVQETTSPYLMKIYRLSDRALSHGISERRRLLNSIAVGFETNNWPGYGDAIEDIDIPMWAYNKKENEL